MTWKNIFTGFGMAFGILWSLGAAGQSRVHLADAQTLILSAISLSGPEISADDLLGRPVVVTFFASWCPPCTDEFEALNDIFDKYGADKVQVVALNVFERFGGRDDPARMARFLERTMPRFTVLIGSPEMRALFGDVQRIPTLIVFDSEGGEIWRFVHVRNAVKMSASFTEIDTVLSALADN